MRCKESLIAMLVYLRPNPASAKETCHQGVAGLGGGTLGRDQNGGFLFG